jgi:uncharacterized protein YjbI with pentapeptide repeats
MGTMEDNSGIMARRAEVVPRARGVYAGQEEELPLEHYVGELIKSGAGLANVFGGPGSGKTTALGHLAAVFGDAIVVVDGPVHGKHLAEKRLVVYATPEREGACAFELAEWGQDEAIEYLLKAHPEKCKSVMARLADGRGSVLGGVAALWVVLLEAMAGDEGLTDVRAVVRGHVGKILGEEGYRRAARYCLSRMAGVESLQMPMPVGIEESAAQLLRNRLVRVLLAGEQFVAELAAEKPRRLPFRREGEAKATERAVERLMTRGLEKDLLAEAAEALRGSAGGRKALDRIFRRDAKRQAMAASLLVGADEAWQPRACPKNLCGAHLAGARWTGVNVAGCDLTGANLQGADLSGGRLGKSRARGANFRGARLVGADLGQIDATGADFAGADLSEVSATRGEFQGASLVKAKLCGAKMLGAKMLGADLTGADLRRGSLVAAQLQLVKVDGADFTDADLTRAVVTGVSFHEAILRWTVFRHAHLIRCDFERMEVENGCFAEADLTGSVLTDSVMPGAVFEGAVLRNTGLAGVMWEGADLRRVNFAGATFHMGSTRSGLVGSVIASEGTRTGFYTDDYNDQDFKAPEEIRKANLCGCDLRGAQVEETDFYLVDLRGAKYTEEQRRHLARCGAILRGR